jgi:methyl-accepting chemotaxis protein
MYKLVAASAVTVVAIGASTACATKKYVQTSVGDVAQEVTSLSDAVEETQERTRRNDARIKEVDTAVQSVRQTAQQADQAAKEAASLGRV